MITQHITRITTAVTGGLKELVQDLLFHFLTALAISLDRHPVTACRCFIVSLISALQPFRAAAVSTFSSRFLYEATNPFRVDFQ